MSPLGCQASKNATFCLSNSHPRSPSPFLSYQWALLDWDASSRPTSGPRLVAEDSDKISWRNLYACISAPVLTRPWLAPREGHRQRRAKYETIMLYRDVLVVSESVVESQGSHRIILGVVYLYMGYRSRRTHPTPYGWLRQTTRRYQLKVNEHTRRSQSLKHTKGSRNSAGFSPSFHMLTRQL
jgi:hypothetical protein